MCRFFRSNVVVSESVEDVTGTRSLPSIARLDDLCCRDHGLPAAFLDPMHRVTFPAHLDPPFEADSHARVEPLVVAAPRLGIRENRLRALQLLEPSFSLWVTGMLVRVTGESAHLVLCVDLIDLAAFIVIPDRKPASRDLPRRAESSLARRTRKEVVRHPSSRCPWHATQQEGRCSQREERESAARRQRLACHVPGIQGVGG